MKSIGELVIDLDANRKGRIGMKNYRTGINKYRIIYQSKTAGEESDYGDWTDEFLRLPYIKADTMEEALKFAKWYTKALGNDADRYEWVILNYDVELQSLNKSLWYAYINGTITLEEYIIIKRSIASCIEDTEK